MHGAKYSYQRMALPPVAAESKAAYVINENNGGWP